VRVSSPSLVRQRMSEADLAGTAKGPATSANPEGKAEPDDTST
jgi:hypothetical protein